MCLRRWKPGKEKDVFFFALCCLGKILGGAPFSQLHKGGKQRRVQVKRKMGVMERKKWRDTDEAGPVTFS